MKYTLKYSHLSLHTQDKNQNQNQPVSPKGGPKGTGALRAQGYKMFAMFAMPTKTRENTREKPLHHENTREDTQDKRKYKMFAMPTKTRWDQPS